MSSSEGDGCIPMTHDGQFLSYIRFSSSYRCDSLLCAARWYETVWERCRPRRECQIWFEDGFLCLSPKKSPQHSYSRFFVHSVPISTKLLAEHSKEVIVFASTDKKTQNRSQLTISCYFKSQNDALEWRIALQRLKQDFDKQRESEKPILEIIELYFNDGPRKYQQMCRKSRGALLEMIRAGLQSSRMTQWSVHRRNEISLSN